MNDDFWKIVMGRKQTEKQPIDPHIVEQGQKMCKHYQKDDSEILIQFTVDCSESLRSCSTAIYVYRDRIDINRHAGCGNITAPKIDTISFDEIDNIVMSSRGVKIGIRFSGEILLSFKAGTRYYYLGTEEHFERKDTKLTEANQILFDAEYNDLVENNIFEIQNLLRKHKKTVKPDPKLHEPQPRNVTINNLGDGQVSYNENSFNTNVDNSITELSLRVQNEVSGEEREEMLRVLYEVELLIQEMKDTGKVTSSRQGKIKKLGEHFQNNSWFYGGIITIIGNAAMKYIFGA